MTPEQSPTPDSDHVLVPRMPTEAMFKAFNGCPDPAFAAAYAAMLAARPTPADDAERREGISVLPDPSHMEWQALHRALWDRLKDDEREDQDLTFSRDEGGALLAWAELFDRQAQPRRDEEQKTFDIIKRSAELIKPNDDEVVFYLRIAREHTHLTTHAGKSTEPQFALTKAIEALEAERGDAAKCPVHSAQPRETDARMRAAVQREIDSLRGADSKWARGIRSRLRAALEADRRK